MRKFVFLVINPCNFIFNLIDGIKLGSSLVVKFKHLVSNFYIEFLTAKMLMYALVCFFFLNVNMVPEKASLKLVERQNGLPNP